MIRGTVIAALLLTATAADARCSMFFSCKHHHKPHHHLAKSQHRTVTVINRQQREIVDCARIKAAVAQLQADKATDWCTADIGVMRCSPNLNKELEKADHRQVAIISGCLRQ